jgi:serine/threonine protein phosphatase PrpC
MPTIVTSGTRQNGAPEASGGVALLQVGAAMDLGLRTNQEDALGVSLPGEDDAARRGGLFVLADGLGGHTAGELASRLAVQTIGAAYYASSMRQPGNLLQSAIEQANRRLLAAGQDPALRGLGSTCVCAAVQGDSLWVANVGDSRAYLLRPPGTLQQLSQDHSMAAEQVRQGLIASEEHADHAMRSVLLQSLGVPSGVQPYFAGPLPLQKGDLLLLCSDGLYNALDERAMHDYLLAALLSTLTVSPDQIARDLVEGARFHGGDDNISALVVYCADVVPEAVARAAGWPQSQARSLFLPMNGASAQRTPDAPAPPAPPAPTSGPVATAPADLEESRGPAGPPADLPYLPAVPAYTRTRIAPLSLAALIGGGALFLLLALAWAAAAFWAPRWLVPIFLTMLALAIPLGGLLFLNRPRLIPIAPPPGESGPPPDDAGAVARAATDPSRSLVTFDDPVATLIARLLPGHGAPGEIDRSLATPGSGPVAPVIPPDAPPDYVSQAMSAALARAHQQWTFNLLMAGVSASLVIGGCLVTIGTLLLGKGEQLGALFGPGVGLLGIVSWLVTQPTSQLNRAGNQISLLTIVWTNYAQELRNCARITDPTQAASCSQRAGAEAVQYFNQIVTEKPS